MSSFLDKTVNDLKIGDTARFVKTIQENDVALFAELTGDKAPHHLNEEYGEATRYGKRIVHGLLTASLCGPAITELVAPGGVTIEHGFRFRAPVFIGDTITTIAEVVDRFPEKKLVKIEVKCVNQNGQTVVDGWGLELMSIGAECN